MLRSLGFSCKGWEVFRGFWGGQGLTMLRSGRVALEDVALPHSVWEEDTSKSSLWNFLALALRSHVFQRCSMSSCCSLRPSRATRTFCCFWVTLDLVISSHSVFWGQRFSHTEKKMLPEGNPPPPLGKVMRKLERFQWTDFYGLWISKCRVR